MKKFTVFLCAAVMLLVGHIASATPIILYDSLPSPTPTNIPSEGYECCQVRQLGQGVTLASSGSFDDVLVTLGLSDWALKSVYDPSGSSTGFDQSLTLNLYNLNPDGTVGSLFASDTITANIPWRPESDNCGGDSTAYTGPDQSCYHGLYNEVSFDLGSLTLPNLMAFGLAFDTQTVGYNPTGVSGPYNSLNFALAGAPSVGSIYQNGSLYVDGQTCYPYDGTNGQSCSDGPAQVFRLNSGWESYNPAASIVGIQNMEVAPVPEPASLVLLGSGLVGLAARAKKKRNKQ